MRGVIYARYSCDKQREESIEGQIRECRQFAQSQGIDVINEYIDRALSATNDQRPAFQRMISDSYLGRFDAVIIWKSDRFSRNRKQAISYRDILKDNKIKLLSATEPNIEGPASILFESMNDGYNEYYVAEMKVKMKRGEKENVLNGKTNGGVPAFGYRTEKYKYYIIENEANTVRYIFDMYANTNLTINGVAELLTRKGLYRRDGNPFTQATVSYILRNRKYIGEYKWGEVSNNCVPPIVKKNLFDTVQAKLKANSKSPELFKTKAEFLLSGKLYCGKCKGPMNGESGTSRNGKVYYYYKCAKAKRGNHCSMKPIKKDIIEDYVSFRALEFLAAEINRERLAEEIHNYQQSTCPLIKELETSLGETSKKMKNLMNAMECGVDPTDLKIRYNELKIRRDELELKVDEEKCRNPVMEIEDIKLALDKYRNMTLKNDREKKLLIDLLINSVVIQEDGDIDVYFNYKEKEPKLRVPDECSPTYLDWSTK